MVSQIHLRVSLLRSQQVTNIRVASNEGVSLHVGVITAKVSSMCLMDVMSKSLQGATTPARLEKISPWYVGVTIAIVKRLRLKETSSWSLQRGGTLARSALIRP